MTGVFHALTVLGVSGRATTSPALLLSMPMLLSEYYTAVMAELKELGCARTPFYWRVDEYLEQGLEPKKAAELMWAKDAKNDKAWAK